MSDQTYSQFSQYFGEQEQWQKDHKYVPSREYIADTHVEAIKNIIIEDLRDLFTKYQEYQYVPRTDGIPGADLDKTGIVITDVYTYEAKFLPIITVRVGSSNTHHISFSQDAGTTDFLYDENGRPALEDWGRPIPIYYAYNEAWDSSVTLNVFTEDTMAREELMTFISVVAINLLRDKWRYEGMFVKSVAVGGESETKFANDYIYNQAVTLDVFSEWTRRVPVPTAILEGINYRIRTVAPAGYPSSTNTLLITPEFSVQNAIFYNGISWQVKSLYIGLLNARLDLGATKMLLQELIDRVNGSGTQLLTLPISQNLTSFNTINIDDFLLLMSHVEDSLRQDGLQLVNLLEIFIGTLTDSSQIASLTSSKSRLKNIERTLTGQLIEI